MHQHLRRSCLALLAAAASSFTPGYFAVLEVQAALPVAGNSSTGNYPVRVLELAPNGTLVRSILIPATVASLPLVPTAAKLLRSADSAFVTFAGYTDSGYAVVSIDGRGTISTLILTGYRGSPALQSAYRNSDGSFYVCSAAGTPTTAFVTPDGSSSDLLVNPSACNFLAPKGNSLLLSMPGSWGLSLVGTAGVLPRSAGLLAFLGGTGTGTAQSFSWVFDNTGTTMFSCVPYTAGYGIWRNGLQTGSSSTSLLTGTLLLHLSNISCFAITGQLEADGFAVYFTGSSPSGGQQLAQSCLYRIGDAVNTAVFTVPPTPLYSSQYYMFGIAQMPLQVPVSLQNVTFSQMPSSSITSTQFYTASQAPSPTPTQTRSSRPTPSPSSTLTPSSRLTPSPSQTQSLSSLPTPSHYSSSQTVSSTATQSSTSSASGTTSVTSSQRPSTSSSQTSLRVSQSRTASTTQEASASPQRASQSASLSNTQQGSTSQTRSGSGARTPSRSRSRSPLVSRSASQLPTPTPTGSQAVTPSGTASPGSSLSNTPTQTPTPTPSPSSAPYALMALVDGNASDALFVSDSLPPSSALSLELNRCPEVALQRSAILTCSAVPDDGVATRALHVSGAIGAVSLSCDGASVDKSPRPLALTAAATFRSPSGSNLLECALTAADGSAMGNASVDVFFQSTFWPLFDDTIIVSGDGTMRSALLGAKNGSSELLNQSCDAGFVVPPAAIGNNISACTVAAALADPAAVLDAVIAAWAAAALPPASNSTSLEAALAALPPFALTLLGPTPIVLRSSVGRLADRACRSVPPIPVAPNAPQLPAFTSETRVTIGRAECTDTVASADGLWLLVTSPTAAALGCDANGDCGHVNLAVINPDGDDGGGSAGRRAQELYLGASIACPPFCPGVIGTGLIVPLAVAADASNGSASGYTYVAASVSESGAVVAVPALAAATTSGSMGLYYSTKCENSGLFTDPASGACTNGSNPDSYGCAFGSGSSCSLCDPGAICPGGSRAWTRPGYYSASEATQHPAPCAQPDPASRCTGWDPVAGRTSCGLPYRQGTYLCGACAAGSYAVGDGSCAICPPIASSWDRYRGLFGLLIAIVGLGIIIYLLLRRMIRMSKTSLQTELTNLTVLIVWLLMAVQVVSQVSRVASAALPGIMRAAYSAVALIQLEGIVLPPSCTGAYPFEVEVGMMGAACGCVVAAIIAYSVGNTAVRRLFGAASTTGALLLLPMAASSAMGLLSCRQVELSPTAVAVLDGGTAYISAAASNSRSTIDVPLLSSDPFFVCWAGSHRPAGYFAIATIVFGIGGFSALTFWWILRDPWLLAQLEALPPGGRVSALVAWAQSVRRATTGAKTALGDPAELVAAVWASAPKATAASATPDPCLEAFFADAGYGPHVWHFRHLDLLAVLVLATLEALIPRPTTLQAVLLKALVSEVDLVGLLVLLLVARPYTTGHRWKLPVRALLLATSAACAALNAATSAIDLGHSTPELVSSVQVGAYAVLAMFLLTALSIVIGFGWEMNRSARVAAKAAEHEEGLASDDKGATDFSKQGFAGLEAVGSPPTRLTGSASLFDVVLRPQAGEDITVDVVSAAVASARGEPAPNARAGLVTLRPAGGMRHLLSHGRLPGTPDAVPTARP